MLAPWDCFQSNRLTDDTFRTRTGSVRPSAVKAHKDLVAALEHMHTWKERQRKGEELLKEMLQSRSEVARLSKKYDIWWVPDAENQRLVPLSL